MKEHPELYAIAKRITLQAGFPYTDPRTLETTQPPKQKPRKKTTVPNSKKIPKWILLDQLHIDINIRSAMLAKERKELLKTYVNNETIHRLFKFIIAGTNKNIRVNITK